MSFKKLLILFLLISIWIGNQSFAQCPGCTIDPTCATTLPEGGICPTVIPDAVVGQFYEESVTFFIPDQIVEQGFDVEIRNITIAEIAGIPFDLEWECNNAANGCFYDVQNGENTGCVKICGTPITAPGSYDIDITVNALVYVIQFGFELTQPQTYTVTVNVLPGEGAATFTAEGAPNCQDGFEVDLCGTVDGSPNITSYNWDLGNGNTSTDQCPPTQTYIAPGAYTVQLETTISGYVLDRICTTSIATDSWCGDVEEPNVFSCSGSPDLYYQLYDASGNLVGGNSGDRLDDTFSGCWNNLNFQMSNPPYNLQIFDYDSVSADDLLCNTSFTPSGANQSFSGAAGNGNTSTGTLNFSTYIVDTFVDSTIIAAFNTPIRLAIESFDVSTIGGSDGFINLTVEGGVGPYTYFWGGAGNTEDLLNIPAGDYAVLVTDANGCQASSAVTINEPIIEPCASLVLSATKTDVSTAGGSDGAIDLSVTGGNPPYTYFWGNGITSQDLSGITGGDYSVQVTDNVGCTATTTVTVNEATAPCNTLTLSVSTTNVSTTGGSDGAIDLTVSGGNPPYSYDWGIQGTTQDISGLTAGTYGVQVTDAAGCLTSASGTISEPTGGQCVVAQDVSNIVDGGTLELSAIESVTSNSQLINNAVVDYHAGNFILLEAGFTVELGVDFDAYIEACQEPAAKTTEDHPVEEHKE